MAKCAEKKAYKSKADAQRRAKTLERQEGKPLFVYQCLTCLKWHLTKKRPAKRSFKSQVTGVRRKQRKKR